MVTLFFVGVLYPNDSMFCKNFVKMEKKMKFIGSKIKQFCHILLYLNILFCMIQVSVLKADIVSSFEYTNISAEYAQTKNGARPRGIAVTKDYIFVADAGLNAIAIYKNSPKGELLLLYKADPNIDGIISYPYDIAYNEKTKKLVLMDQLSTDTRYLIYDFVENADGTIKLSFNEGFWIDFKYVGLTFNDTGDKIYSVASDGYDVLMFDLNTYEYYSLVFANQLSNNSFAGIDYYTDGSSEYLAIAEPAVKAIKLFKLNNGKIELEKKLPLVSDATNISFAQPTDVDIWTMESGKVVYVVTDRANSCVDIFDFTTGEFIIKLGVSGTAKSKLSLPYCSVGLDGLSTVYVADSNNRRVASYNVTISDNSSSGTEENQPTGDPNVEIKFTAISMTNLVVSLVGADPMGYYMLDSKAKLTDDWSPALQSNIYVPALQSDFPITGCSFVGTSETFDISGEVTESAGSKQYSLDIPISVFVNKNDAANINSSFFRFRRLDK